MDSEWFDADWDGDDPSASVRASSLERPEVEARLLGRVIGAEKRQIYSILHGLDESEGEATAAHRHGEDPGQKLQPDSLKTGSQRPVWRWNR